MTLYEIAQELENFEFEIDEETGEILNAEELDKLEMERDTKIENIALWIKNLRAEADAIKRERDNLSTRMERTTKKADSLENYLSSWLNGKKFATAKVQIGWRKSSRVEIVNELLLPKKYVKVTETIKPDKALIKEHLKNGENIVGAELIERQKIQVK